MRVVLISLIFVMSLFAEIINNIKVYDYEALNETKISFSKTIETGNFNNKLVIDLGQNVSISKITIAGTQNSLWNTSINYSNDDTPICTTSSDTTFNCSFLANQDSNSIEAYSFTPDGSHDDTTNFIDTTSSELKTRYLAITLDNSSSDITISNIQIEGTVNGGGSSGSSSINYTVSTNLENYEGFGSSNVIDSDNTTKFCTQKPNDGDIVWLQLDLGAQYDLATIKLDTYTVEGLDNDLRNQVLGIKSSSEGFVENKTTYTSFSLPSTYDASTTLNIETKTRYLRLEYDYKGSSDRHFCIGEFTVTGTQSSNQSSNIALGKEVTQSSTKDIIDSGFPIAEIANDGLLVAKSIYESSQSKTKTFANQDSTKNWYENKLYWEIDLGANYTIENLIIHKGDNTTTVNSNYSNEDIFTYSKVIVSSTPFNSNPSGDYSFVIGNMYSLESKEVVVDKSAIRYIRIEPFIQDYHNEFDNSNINLNLEEVIIHGKKDDYQLPEGTINAAFEATATQSTTALDANDAFNNFGSSTLWNDSTKDETPWVIVDLGAEYNISQLKFDIDVQTYIDQAALDAYNNGVTNEYDSSSEGTYKILLSRVPFDTNPKGTENFGKYDFNLVLQNHNGGKISFPDSFLTQSVSDVGAEFADTYEQYTINAVARYIKIEVTKAASALKVSNFKAFGIKESYQLPEGTINAAFNSTPAISSVYSINDYSGHAYNCIDTNIETTCLNTHTDTQNYFILDLGAFYDVSQIKLYDKIDMYYKYSDTNIDFSVEGLKDATLKLSAIHPDAATFSDITSYILNDINPIDTKPSINTNRYNYYKIREITFDQVKKTRYIKIEKSSPLIGLADIKVYGTKSDTQVLAGYSDVATTSNINLSAHETGSKTSFANDGNTDSRISTTQEANSFIELDLENYYDIFNIIITENSTNKYLEGATLKISNLPFDLNPDGDFTYTINSVNSDVITIDTKNQVGRYVRIEQSGTKRVAFDDIKINAKLADKPTNLSYLEPSVNATEKSSTNTYDMDLGAQYDLKSIQILANLNTPEQLYNADIIFSRTDIAYTPDGEYKVNLGALIGNKISLSSLNLSARYIRIVSKSDTISLRDVTVYASALCSNPLPNGTGEFTYNKTITDKGDYWELDLGSQIKLREITLYNNANKLETPSAVKISRIPFDTNPYGDTVKNSNTIFDEVIGRYLSVPKSLGDTISFRAFGLHCNCDYYSNGDFIEETYKDLENAAYKKGITQSSGTNSYNLLDGNISTNASTQASKNPYVEIDLHDYYSIRYVELYAKTLDYSSELANIKVEFSSYAFSKNSSDIEELTLTNETFNEKFNSKFIPGDKTLIKNNSIRYVRVTKITDNGTLDLSQIQILAKKSTKPSEVLENIALTKNVTSSQSITTANNITDGKKATTITLSNASNPYVIIDLGGIYDISSIELVRKISWENISNNSDTGYLNNSTIYFSKVPFPDNPYGDISINLTSTLYNTNSIYEVNNTQARYLKLVANGDNRVLTLADLIVRGKISTNQEFSSLYNASYLKNIAQSDGSIPDAAKYVVDGITNASIASNNVTKVYYNPSKITWLELDLGKVVDISKIEVFSPTDWDIQGIQILTSIVPFDSNPVGDNPKIFNNYSSNGLIGSVSYDKPLSARYVRILRHDTKNLVLAEVKVYAKDSLLNFEEGTTNVAFNKEVTSDLYYDHLENVVDSDRDTNAGYNSWVEIDLGAEYDIKYITWEGSTLYDGTYTPKVELSQLPISTFKYNIESYNMIEKDVDYSRRINLYVAVDTTARYVRVYNTSGIVKEISVFGKLSSNQDLNDFENMSYNLKPFKTTSLVYSNNPNVNDWYIPVGDKHSYITYDLGKQALIKFIELNGIHVRYQAYDDFEILVSKVPFDTNPNGDYRASLKGSLDEDSLAQNINRIIKELDFKGRYVQIRSTNAKGGFFIDDISVIAKPILNTFQFDENSQNATYAKPIEGKYAGNAVVLQDDLKLYNDSDVETTTVDPSFIRIDLNGYYDIKNIEIFGSKESLRATKISASASQLPVFSTSENQLDILTLSADEFEEVYENDRLILDVDYKMVRYIALSNMNPIKEIKAFGNKSKIQMSLDTKDRGTHFTKDIIFDNFSHRDLKRVDLFNFKPIIDDNNSAKLLVYSTSHDDTKPYEITLEDKETQYIYINNTASRVKLEANVTGTPILRVHAGDKIPLINNLTSNATATQSSNFGAAAVASHAIDGDNISFSYTKQERNPWLEIDLKKVYLLKDIELEFPFAIDKNSVTNESIYTYKVFVSTTPISKKLKGDKEFTIYDLDNDNKKTLNVNKEARYIRIALEGLKNLSLEEVKISGYDIKPQNIALFKPTFQTTTIDNHSSDKAVDGISIHDEENEFDSIIRKGDYEYWQVDLGELTDIYNVEVIGSDNYPMSDSTVVLRTKYLTTYSKEISPFGLRVNSDGNTHIEMTPNKTAQFVRIYTPNGAGISEVRVNGVSYDETRYETPFKPVEVPTGGDGTDTTDNSDNTGNMDNSNTNTGNSGSTNTSPNRISSGELVDYIKNKMGAAADALPEWVWDILRDFSITIENPKFVSDKDNYFKITGEILLDDLGKHNPDNLFVKVLQSSFKAMGKLFDFDGDGKIPIELALVKPEANNGELDFHVGLTLADSWQETGDIPPLNGNMAFKSFTMTGHAKASGTALFDPNITFSVESIGEFFLKPSSVDDWMQAQIIIEPEISLTGDIDIVVGAQLSGICKQPEKGKAIDADKNCTDDDWNIFKLGMIQSGGAQLKITFAPDNASTGGVAAIEGYVLGGKIGSHGSKITTSFRGEMLNIKKLTPDEVTSIAMNGTGLYLYADKVNMDTYFNNILPLPDIEPIKTVRDGLGTALSIFGGFEDLEVYMSPSIGGFSVGDIAAYLKKDGSTYPKNRELPNLHESGAAFRTDLDILGIKSTMHASLETNYLENGISALSHVFSDPVKLIEDATSIKIKYGFGGSINFDDFNSAIQKGAGSVPLLGPILEEIVSSFVFHEAKLDLTFTQALVPDVGGGASLWFTIFGEDIKPKVDFGVLFSPFKFVIDFIVDKVGQLGKIIIEGIAEAGKAIAKGVEEMFDSVGQIVDGVLIATEHLMDGAVEVANKASLEGQKVLDSAEVLLSNPSITNLSSLGYQLASSAINVASAIGETLGTFVIEVFNTTGKAIACSPLNFIDKPSYCDKEKEMVLELNSFAVYNWDWYSLQHALDSTHDNQRLWNDEKWDKSIGAPWFDYREYTELNPVILEFDEIATKELKNIAGTGKAFDYFKFWQNHQIIIDRETAKAAASAAAKNASTTTTTTTTTTSTTDSTKTTEKKVEEQISNMFTGALGSRNFSSQYYLYRYKDVKAAFKDDSFAGALQHYSTNGMKEKRTATPVAPIKNDYLDICRSIVGDKGILSGHWVKNNLACAIGDIDKKDYPSHTFEILRLIDVKPLKEGEEEEEGHSVIYTGGLLKGTMQRSKVCAADINDDGIDDLYGHTDKNSNREIVCVVSSQSLIKKDEAMNGAVSSKNFHYLQAKYYTWVTPDYINLSGSIKISDDVLVKDIALGNHTLWLYATNKDATSHWIYTRANGKLIKTSIDGIRTDGNGYVFGADSNGHLWIKRLDDTYTEYILDNKTIKKVDRTSNDVNYSIFSTKSNHTMSNNGTIINYNLSDKERREYQGHKYNEYRGIKSTGSNVTKDIFVENKFVTFDIDVDGTIWVVGENGIVYHDILAPTYLETSKLKGLATDRFNLNDLKDMSVDTLNTLDDNAKLVSAQTGVELTFTTDTGGIFKVKPASKDKAITKVDIINALPDGVTAIKLYDIHTISKSLRGDTLTDAQQLSLDLVGYYDEDVYYDLGTGEFIKVSVRHYKAVEVPQEAETVEVEETNSFEETLSLSAIKNGWNAYGNSMQYNAIDAKKIFNTSDIYTYVNGNWNKSGIIQPGQAFWVFGGAHNINIDLSQISGSTALTQSYKDTTQWNFLVATEDTTVETLSQGTRKVWAFNKVDNTWHDENTYSLNKGDVYWLGPKAVNVETKDERATSETMVLPTLSEGWNLLGNRMSESSILINEVFTNKKAYVYSNGSFNETTTIQPGQAFYINLEESDLSVNVNITGYSTSRSDYKDIISWNLLTATKSLYIGDLTSSKGKVWAYNRVNNSWHDELDYKIETGEVYYIQGLPMNLE